MMKVLLTNAESAKTLACMRALGKEGVEIYVTGYHKHSPAFYSKYYKGGILINKPQNEERFVREIIEVISKKNIDILMPINSVETLILSKYHDKISKLCKFPFETFERMKFIDDKGNLMKIAEKLNVPIPKTFHNPKSENIKIDFPCVLKLSNSTSSKGVFYPKTKNEMEKLLKEYSHVSKIVQEYVEGRGCGVSYLYDKGKMIAYFAHERLREYPIKGGPSTYRISIRDENLVKLGKKILDYIKWDGIAMVEFKRTDNGYKLIEINPRFWGSVNTAILSGVNFPYLLVQKAFGEDIKIKMGGYKTGVKTKLYLNDVKSIISHIRNKKYSLWRIFEIFNFGNSDELALEDLKPFFYYMYHTVRYKR